MRIEWAIPCRFVELYGLATIVGAGIDTYWLPEIPSPVQVFMAIRLVAPEEELGDDKPHQLVVRVLGPDMQPIGDELTMEFAAPANPMKRPGWEGGIIMRVVHVFSAEEIGVYTIELAVDGRGHSTSVIVEQGTPPT